MSNEIRRCSALDVAPAWELVETCSRWLSSKGMHHWRDYYTKNIVEKKINDAIVYGFFSKKDIIGIGCLGEEDSGYYRQDYLNLCKDFSVNAMYMSMLAVSPSSHGKGIASNLIISLEDCARRNGADFIRLNAFTRYRELGRFYLNRGYSFLGSVVDKDGDEMSFYEKDLR